MKTFSARLWLSSVTITVLTLVSPSVLAKIIFSQFSGYREWPQEKAAMADTSYAVPVYRTWPDRPYIVLGSLKFGNPNASWNEGDVRQVAKEAKKRGGQGIVLRFGVEGAVFALSAAAAPSGAFSSWQPSALVIRFRTIEEIQADEDQQRELFSGFRAKYMAEVEQKLAENPPATFSEETARLAVKFLLQSGVNLKDPSLAERFVAVMARVSVEHEHELSGEWLFKVDFETSTLTGSDTSTAFGIAAVKADANGIVIVSREGGAELNFSGLETGGRISGQLGVYRVSAKADGALLNDKISLTCSTTTPGGAVRCTVVFQRSAIPRRILSPAFPSDPPIKKS